MFSAKFKLVLTLTPFLAALSFSQQSSPPPQDHMQMNMQQHENMQPVEPVYPILGRAQQSGEKLFSLADA
ncbi:MAG: hypothetical protein WBW49_17965, partial [Candidatus Acidiferrum sp.]